MKESSFKNVTTRDLTKIQKQIMNKAEWSFGEVNVNRENMQNIKNVFLKKLKQTTKIPSLSKYRKEKI